MGGNSAYNAKMEEHLKDQQQQLEQAQAALTAAQQAESQVRLENESLVGELKDLRELMSSEAANRAALQDTLDQTERQLGELRNELDMTKSALTASAAMANEHCGRAEVEHARLAELEGLIDAKHKELEEVQVGCSVAVWCAVWSQQWLSPAQHLVCPVAEWCRGQLCSKMDQPKHAWHVLQAVPTPGCCCVLLLLLPGSSDCSNTCC